MDKDLKEKLQSIKEEGVNKLNSSKTVEELFENNKELTSKKSKLAEVLQTMGSLDPDVRKEVGILVTDIKNTFSSIVEKKQREIIDNQSVLDKPLDLTLPGNKVSGGALHPITQMVYDLNDAFASLGFEIYSEDDISSEKYAFDNLNFAKDHPARQSMDTYWLEGTEEKEGAERLCLRPHLTGGSVRKLLKDGAPARFVYPGCVYRNETTDARHERAFYQYEALIVDKNVSFSSGIVMIEAILEKVFGRKINTRMREGFFPFTEPGYEIDMECLVCGGKGCPVCHNVGWIEVMPGGVINPNVLKSANLDPEEWTGFYINIGVDRLVMMRYGIDDVRLLRSGDLRFLKDYK